MLQLGQRRTVGPSWSVAAFAPVHGSLGAVSVVEFALGVEVEAAVAVAAVVPRSASEVVLGWIAATEHGAIVAQIDREAAAAFGLGIVAGPEIVPLVESE